MHAQGMRDCYQFSLGQLNSGGDFLSHFALSSFAGPPVIIDRFGWKSSRYLLQFHYYVLRTTWYDVSLTDVSVNDRWRPGGDLVDYACRRSAGVASGRTGQLRIAQDEPNGTGWWSSLGSQLDRAGQEKHSCRQVKALPS
jgi:hypothetical protein